jgi:hypothetical protein
MGESRLWQICGSREQERLSSQFAALNVEFVRDAILDAEDSTSVPGPSERRQEIIVGRIALAGVDWLSRSRAARTAPERGFDEELKRKWCRQEIQDGRFSCK